MGRILRWYFAFIVCILVAIFYYGYASGKSYQIPTRNVNSYGGLISAVSALSGVSNVALVITDNQVLSGSSLSIPSNISVRFVNGGQLSGPASGITVNFHGPVDAGLYQIFPTDSSVTPVFHAGSVKEVYPKWWGINNDGTDDSMSLQVAIDCAYNSHVSTVNISGLDNLGIATPIELKPGVKLDGGMRTGGSASIGYGATLKAIGAISSVVKAVNVEEVGLKNVHISGNSLATDGLYIDGCKHSRFENIYIDGASTAQLHLLANSGTYYNVFDRIKVNGGTYGVKIESPTSTSEANTNRFYNLDAWGAGGAGTYGVYLNYALANVFIDPTIQQYDYAFFLDQGVRTFTVIGGYTEGNVSGTFKMDGQTTTGGPLYIIGLRAAEATEFYWVGGSELSGFGLGRSIISTVTTGIYQSGNFYPSKFEMASGATDPLRIRDLPIYEVQGISATSTLCKNMGGTHIIAAGNTYVDVSLLNTEPDIFYKVIVTPLSNPGGYLWVDNRTTTGFRINVSTAPASDLYVYWFIFRGAQ
jgi:hypothetical protein